METHIYPFTLILYDMTFVYTLDGRTLEGIMFKAWGTFTNGAGDTGGDIDTGLSRVESFIIKEKGSSVVANKSVIDETFVTGRNITIVTDSDVDGYWEARGYVS